MVRAIEFALAHEDTSNEISCLVINFSLRVLRGLGQTS
jgi:hypothetical protein